MTTITTETNDQVKDETIEAAVATEAKEKKSIQQIAKELGSQLTVDENNHIEDKSEGAATLENHGLTLDQVKAVQTAVSEHTTALTIASGNMALDKMKKDSGVDSITFAGSVGHQQIKGSIQKEKKMRSPATGEDIIVHGATTVAITQRNASSSRGDLKKAIGDVKQKFSDQFKK